MPKHQPKNAFFYFMIDYKKKQENSGFKYPGGLTQVQQECSKIWDVGIAFKIPLEFSNNIFFVF